MTFFFGHPLLRSLNIITSSRNLVALPHVTKEEMLKPKNGIKTRRTEKNGPTDRYSVNRGKDLATSGKSSSKAEKSRNVIHLQTSKGCVDEYLVLDEVENDGNEDHPTETRTVRFVEESCSVNNNDTKRRRSWKDVAREAKGNLLRTEEALKRKAEKREPGYDWLSDDSQEFSTRYGDVSSEDTD